ncbi:helix-turn-helix domain-containing protein [Nocardia takedensis]
MSDLHAGQRVAAERKLAGLTQRQLASRANYSLGLVKAYEQGREPASPAFLAAAARVLCVELERLTGEPYRDLIETDGPLRGVTELRAILTEGRYLEVMEPGPLGHLRAELDAVDRMYLEDRGRDALVLLPNLIRRLHGALHEVSDPAPVWTMLAQAWAAADRSTLQFNLAGFGPSVLDRLDEAAERGDDPLYRTQALVKRARRLMYLDQHGVGLNLIERALDGVEGDSEGARALRGSAHLTGSIVAARGFRLDIAEDHLREARQLAAPMTGDTSLYGTLFGPTNVKIHSTAIALESGDPGRAAHEGSTLTVPREPIALPRIGHHWQDVARAWLLIGKPDLSLNALDRARRIAPQQTKLHPSVRETVYGIAAAQRRQKDSVSSFAAWLGVKL